MAEKALSSYKKARKEFSPYPELTEEEKQSATIAFNAAKPRIEGNTLIVDTALDQDILKAFKRTVELAKEK